jgi:acetyl esterase/lipase
MLNPELHAFLERWDDDWAALAPDATPRERREFFEVMARGMRLATPDDIETEDVRWIESPGGPVRVRIFRHSSGGIQPCLIYMHGGAWIQGSPETHWDITSRIASWNRQTVISIDYAKAPEHPFPIALNQCASVIEWAFKNAGELGIDRENIALGGDSAGGNLAAALTLKFRGSEQNLCALLLIYPVCDFDYSRPSYEENYDGPLIKVAGMGAVRAMYCPDPKDMENPLVAPLLAADHTNLPPTFIAVAEHDPLRDSGLAYADALRAAGVPVEVDAGEGLIHGYLRAMEYCSASLEGLKRMANWIDAHRQKDLSVARG